MNEVVVGNFFSRPTLAVSFFHCITCLLLASNSTMKVFAMLGLVALASAENDNDKIVQRRRLALSQCTFADNVDGVHNIFSI